jgi:hypothetical protein
VTTLAQSLRRRALALVAVLAALGVVVGVVVADNQPAQPEASCGYVLSLSPFPHWIWYCPTPGGGGIGSW